MIHFESIVRGVVVLDDTVTNLPNITGYVLGKETDPSQIVSFVGHENM